jgi:hypothetical protein
VIHRYYKDITCEFDGVGDKMELAKKIADFVAKVPRAGHTLPFQVD